MCVSAWGRWKVLRGSWVSGLGGSHGDLVLLRVPPRVEVGVNSILRLGINVPVAVAILVLSLAKVVEA